LTSRPSSIAQSVTGAAAGMAILYFLRGVLIPLIVAIVLAILVNAVVRLIADRVPRAPRWAVGLLAALVVIGSVAAGIYVLAQGAARMVAQGPQLITRIDETVQLAGQALRLKEPVNLAVLTGQVNVPHLAGSVLGGAQSALSALLLIVTYFGFIVAGRSRMRRLIANLSSSSGGKESIKAAVEHISADIETYVWVQTVTGLMIAAVSAAVMFAVGLDNAWFWTILLFLLCFIPMIGVTVGSIVPALFALLQFASWWQAAAIFGGIQVVAFIVGNLIYPRLQAETQNINPIATLLALSFWGSLWGLTGAFLAVPLTLMVMMVCAYFEQSRWVAVLLSDDGKPSFPKLQIATRRKRSARARPSRDNA
jgi:predicted PurR-regulated permease PerM